MQRLIACLTLGLSAPMGAAAQSPPVLRLVPVARVDAATSDLSPIGWLTVGPSGTIAIAQPQDFNIRFFSRIGSPVGSFGRKGRGPGEFEVFTLYGWVGDSLWIGDFDTHRITLLAPDGSLIRSNMWPQGVRSDDPSRPVPRFLGTPIHAFYSDGSVVVAAIPPNAGTPAWMKQPAGTWMPFVHVNKDGVFQRVVLWTHDENDLCNADGVTRPLCFQPFWVVSKRGRVFALAQIERSDQANDFVRTLAVNERGDTLFSRVFPVRRERIPAPVRDSVGRAFQALLRKSRGVPVDLIEIPEVYPAFVQGIVATDERSIWFERGVAVGDREWMIVDMTGVQTARLRVPRRFELKAVSNDGAWGIERDKDGLEHIVVYRIQR